MTEQGVETEEQRKFRYKAGAFLTGIAGNASVLNNLQITTFISVTRNCRNCWIYENIVDSKKNRSKFL